jgi:type IV pilus assembly protein PilX
MILPNPRIIQIRPARNSQQGVVLVVALIVLVAMTLAGIGMMRAADTNSLIAGNLAFKNAATTSADAAIESARAWLTGQLPGVLENNHIDMGYVASWDEAFDPTSFDWLGQGKFVGEDATGNRIYYVAHRMCNESGKSINNTACVKVTDLGTGQSKGGGVGGYTVGSPKKKPTPYFRITARVEGPKSTISYVQGFVY